MDNEKESIISVSVIDYIGVIEDGVAMLLNVIIFDEVYEMSYWFNRKGSVRLIPEKKFLDKINVENIYEYKSFNDLILLIHTNIPKVDEILDEFIN